MNNAKTATTAGLLIVAGCTACCAPLIAAPVLGLIAAGGAGLALAGQIGLGALVLAGLGLYLVARRRRAAASLAAATGCGCAPDAGCNTGDACELPATNPAALNAAATS